MSKISSKKIFFFFPRIFLFFLIAFFAVFATDVFNEDWRLVEKLVAFFMQLLPSIIMTVFLYVFWKKDFALTIVFSFLGVFSFFFFDGFESFGAFLFTTLPFIVISSLFFLSYKKNKT